MDILVDIMLFLREEKKIVIILITDVLGRAESKSTNIVFVVCNIL